MIWGLHIQVLLSTCLAWATLIGIISSLISDVTNICGGGIPEIWQIYFKP